MASRRSTRRRTPSATVAEVSLEETEKNPIEESLELSSDKEDDVVVLPNAIVDTKKQPAAESSLTEKLNGTNGVPKMMAQINNTVDQSDGDDDDDSDDDDDDDDIGAMFQQVKGRRRQQVASDCSSSEDGESGNSDEECEAVGSNPKKRTKFSQRLAQKNKQVKLSQMAKRAMGSRYDSAYDSDSDVEVLDDSAGTSKAPPENVNQPLELSDSEDEKPIMTTKTKDSEFAKAFAQLKDAQSYHAEDLDIPEPEQSLVLRNATNKGTSTTSESEAPPRNTAQLGPLLKLTLRTQEVNNMGKPEGGSCDTVLSVRENEPLEALLKMYLSKNNLTKDNATVTMTFDGVRLLWNHTAASYEMENLDLIHVLIVKKRQNLGPKIQVKLRLNGKEEQECQVRMKEPLHDLLDRYVTKNKISKVQAMKLSLHFDGEKVDLKATPESFDMESGDLVDIHM